MGGALAAAGAAHALTGAALGAAKGMGSAAACEPSGPGIAASAIAAGHGGRSIWAANTHLTTITKHDRQMKRGRSIDVGGAPRAIAITPGGRLAVVATAFYDRPGVAIADLRGGGVSRVDAGPEPCAVAIGPDGDLAYVTDGSEEGTLTVIDLSGARAGRALAVGRHARGVAVTPDGDTAVVAVGGGRAVAFVDLERMRLIGRVRTLPFPREIAVSPDGERAFVTHNGFGAHQVTVIDIKKRRQVKRTPIGRGPAGLAFNRSGSRALVALGDSGRVAVLDGHSGRRLRSMPVGGFPSAVTSTGNSGFVADRGSGRIVRIRIGRS
jgi:DNA-binding beta-propeller fold protein YncE